MVKEDKLENRINHKIFLIILKYIPHITAFFYAIYNLLGILDIDCVILGHLIHMSVFSWIFLYLSSYIFRYCYVHRLPLYYIAACDSITLFDYYIGIPLSDIGMIELHLVILSIIIYGYSYYYLKYVKDNKKFTSVDN